MLLGSSILELALGMIFFYFLLSILCSHINELIAGLLNRRGTDLVRGIRDLLNFPPAEGSAKAVAEEWPEDVSETLRLIKTHFDRCEFGDLLLRHPLIEGLATQSPLPWQDKHRADYIPDQTFALALIGTLLDAHHFMQLREAVRRNGQNDQQTLAPPAGQTAEPVAATSAAASPETTLEIVRETVRRLPDGPRRALLPLVGGSARDIDQVRRNIEHWYNAKMDRVSGVYKRRTQLWLLLIGMIATLALNADSLAVVTALWQYPTLRQAIAEQATQTASASPAPAPDPASSPEVSSQLSQIQQDVQTLLTFPIGWGRQCAYNRWANATIRGDAQGQPVVEQGRVVPFDQPNCAPQIGPFDWSGWGLKLLGFSVTAVAISLGASFWFDLLRKVSNIRSSGPAPGEPTATATAQKARQD